MSVVGQASVSAAVDGVVQGAVEGVAGLGPVERMSLRTGVLDVDPVVGLVRTSDPSVTGA